MPSHQTCTQPELHDRRLPTADLMRISGGLFGSKKRKAKAEAKLKLEVIDKSPLLQMLISGEYINELRQHAGLPTR